MVIHGGGVVAVVRNGTQNAYLYAVCVADLADGCALHFASHSIEIGGDTRSLRRGGDKHVTGGDRAEYIVYALCRNAVGKQIVKALGAGWVCLTGLDADEPYRFPLAKKLGADRLVNVMHEDIFNTMHRI